MTTGRANYATLAAVLSAGPALMFLPVANSAQAPPGPGVKVQAHADSYGDPLPEGALLRLGTVRYRAEHPNDAALSADGKTLATASRGVITLWDVASGRPLHRLRDAKVPPEWLPNQTFLCFSPDGKRLVSLEGWNPRAFVPEEAEAEQFLHVWDTASGKEVHRVDLRGGTKQDFSLAAQYVWFSPDGKEIGVVLHCGTVRFLDPTTGREVRRWTLARPVRWYAPGIAVSADGKMLALFGGDEGDVLLIDVLTGREVRRVTALFAAGQFGENVALSPDSAFLAVADNDFIRLFEVKTGKVRKSFARLAPRYSNSQMPLLALTFSADGTVLYAATEERQILRWRLPGGTALPAMPAEATPGMNDLSSRGVGIYPSPDGRSVVSVERGNGMIRRWDTATDQEIPPPDGFTGVACCRLSPDGRQVAVGDYAGKLELFDAATGRLSRVLRRKGSDVVRLGWSPDGKMLAAVKGNDTTGVWDVGTGQEVRVLGRQSGWWISLVARRVRAGLPVNTPAFSADGRRLLTSHPGLCVWDLTTGEELRRDKSLCNASFSPDCNTVAAVSGSKGPVLLEVATGAVRAMPGYGFGRDVYPPNIASVAFSPDGRQLAVGYINGVICLVDVKSGEERSRLTLPWKPTPASLVFSPDGKWLLGGGLDKVVRLWEVPGGKELLRLTGHESSVVAEFGPGLRTVVSSSADGTVLVWDLCRPAGPRVAGPAALWSDLASGDGPTIYRAIRTLADDPKTAVALLREKLPPAPAADEKRLRQLVRGLDAAAFADREKASRELLASGSPAVPLLKKLQTEPGSVEVRNRLRDVVEGLSSREVTDFRLSRAVQALELSATAEARQLLRDWSGGAASVALAEDARAALNRLEQADKVRRAGDKP